MASAYKAAQAQPVSKLERTCRVFWTQKTVNWLNMFAATDELKLSGAKDEYTCNSAHRHHRSHSWHLSKTKTYLGKNRPGIERVRTITTTFCTVTRLPVLAISPHSFNTAVSFGVSCKFRMLQLVWSLGLDTTTTSLQFL